VPLLLVVYEPALLIAVFLVVRLLIRPRRRTLNLCKQAPLRPGVGRSQRGATLPVMLAFVLLAAERPVLRPSAIQHEGPPDFGPAER
jgi:hypothetical protein